LSMSTMPQLGKSSIKLVRKPPITLEWDSVAYRTMALDKHVTRWMHFKLPYKLPSDDDGWRFLVDRQGNKIPLIGRPDDFDLAVSQQRFQAKWDPLTAYWVLCYRDNTPYIAGGVQARHIMNGVKGAGGSKGRRYVTPSWPGLPPLPPRRNRTH
jgi:hypothetical protein